MSAPTIAVVGTGYVGLVTAAGFAELGSDVWCVDIDAEKVARLSAGEVPIHEPGLAEVLTDHGERLHFTTEIGDALEHASLVFIAVGTPPSYSGDADLSAVDSVIESLPVSKGHALVMKSTVPSGTGRSIVRRLAQAGKAGYGYVSCPEFLREGSALADFRRPDRVVIGDDGGWAGDAVAELYSPLETTIVRTDVTSAEMVKLAANAFLATKISFINEIANVCEETGADVEEVARGMGLDTRIGESFLRPGIGFGGSCLVDEETVLVRHHGRTTLLTFERLWDRVARELGEHRADVLEPDALEVLSWIPGFDEPQFMRVMCLTRREFEGDLIEVTTKSGRRLTTTADHPWLVSDGRSSQTEHRLAHELGPEDWVPLAMGRAETGDEVGILPLVAAAEAAQLAPDQLIVRPGSRRIQDIASRSLDERRGIFAEHPRISARTADVRRTGALRLHEYARTDLPLRDVGLFTARNGQAVSSELALDDAFWRVVGLYLAEGHHSMATTERGTVHRVCWSFHPESEQHLVDEVVAYWLRHGVNARVTQKQTARCVHVQSRLVGEWWSRVLGLGSGSYTQRLPDLIWDRSDRQKWALLSGLFEGDGSWSLVNGGPSVIVEFGTVSDELADGVLRLLGDLEIIASRRVGRSAKSTKDTHWIRISGADQVTRALALVPERDRPGVLCSIANQRKRIAPTGSRRFDERGPAFVRVTGTRRRPFRGPVYSMEVPGSHTFVTSGGLTVSNCFPKDVSALKQLAGNSGYHFQLLNAVIEVNELQKRRVISKLQKHLGQLAGKRVALLGLAFKPDTDDMREASSLVLAARLQAEGALVTAYDPIASEAAADLMPGVELMESAFEALRGADAVVIVTEWPEFAELDWSGATELMSGRVVVDGRNALDAAAVRAAGFVYEGIGRR